MPWNHSNDLAGNKRTLALQISHMSRAYSKRSPDYCRFSQTSLVPGFFHSKQEQAHKAREMHRPQKQERVRVGTLRESLHCHPEANILDVTHGWHTPAENKVPCLRLLMSSVLKQALTYHCCLVNKYLFFPWGISKMKF